MSDLKLTLQVQNELIKIASGTSYLGQKEWTERKEGNISSNLTSFLKKEDILEITINKIAFDCSFINVPAVKNSISANYIRHLMQIPCAVDYDKNFHA